MPKIKQLAIDCITWSNKMYPCRELASRFCRRHQSTRCNSTLCISFNWNIVSILNFDRIESFCESVSNSPKPSKIRLLSIFSSISIHYDLFQPLCFELSSLDRVVDRFRTCIVTIIKGIID